MLDDALIHLRYASVLHDHHFLSFDGIHPSYGASSLLYVSLLALLRSFTHSPLLPKAVSLIAYAVLLVLACWITRMNQLAMAIILVLVSPFAVRWLTDGMETSLACLLAATFCITLHRRAPHAALAATALALSLLRVDLTLLVAFGVLLLLDRRDWLRAVSLCVGSGLSLAFIRLTMGHLLPDTAVAKEGLPFFEVFIVATREIIATGTFGLGTVIVWMASAGWAWQTDRRSAVICNLPFPILMLLAAAKGQQIHGVRYVIWALLFSIVWNFLVTARVSRPRPRLLAAFACVLAACWIFELPVTLSVDRGRSQTLEAMENSHLDRLHGEGLAGDVGYIAYFSDAPICDLNGLVNGRATAMLTETQRTQRCLAENPSFLFISANQYAYLTDFFHMNIRGDWFECGTVDFTNVGSNDRHWLWVRRSKYPHGCPVHLESLQDKETHRLSTSSAPL